jgi:hypothetical protein
MSQTLYAHINKKKKEEALALPSTPLWAPPASHLWPRYPGASVKKRAPEWEGGKEESSLGQNLEIDGLCFVLASGGLELGSDVQPPARGNQPDA